MLKPTVSNVIVTPAPPAPTKPINVPSNNIDKNIIKNLPQILIFCYRFYYKK